MENYIGNRLEKGGQAFQLSILREYEFVLLFIGANWSHPCGNFLPEFKKFYSEVNEVKKDLEVIYVSCDKSKEDFDLLVEEFEWCYVPFKFYGLREIITRHYEVIGIPTVLLINSWGNLISNTCVADISRHTSLECIELWRSKLKESDSLTPS